MKIHPVNSPKNDTNRYCGPSAISIVTNMATGEAARLLRYVSGRSSIKGTGTSDMSKALRMCGIRMQDIHVARRKDNVKDARPTLTQWLADSIKMRTAGRVFLVSAGHHWQIISGRRFCCGRTKQIVSITDKSANRRARVRAVYELSALAEGISIPKQARKESSPATQTAKDRALFAADCRRRRLTWTRTGDDYIEIEPCDEFPDGLTFLFDGWRDAIEMVDRALRHPEDISLDGYLSH